MRAASTLLAFLLVAPALGAWAAGQESTHVYTAESLGEARHRIGLEPMSWGTPWLGMGTPTGKGIRIGLIDTGLDASHPDLQGILACPYCWRDFVGDATRAPFTIQRPYDDHGHGTHVAGILAGRGHFQGDPFHAYWITGARGIAPDAKLIVAKAMDSQGEGSDSRVADAVRWALDPDGDPATDDGADVINLSIGIEPPGSGTRREGVVGTATRAAIFDALGRGVPVVASSGNDGAAQLREPGDIPLVIAVAAVDGDRHLTAFSNRGPGLDLLAPGVLVSTYPTALDSADSARDGYAAMAGTSMAAPIVAGTLALILEADPGLRHIAPGATGALRVERLQALLKETAQPTSDDGGAAGLLDVQAALRGAGLVVAPLPDIVPWTLGAVVVLLVGGMVYRRRIAHPPPARGMSPAAPAQVTPRPSPAPPPSLRPARMEAPPAVLPFPPRAPLPRPQSPIMTRPSQGPLGSDQLRSPSVAPPPARSPRP